ncbi:MAG TPA: SAM-dependent methyltransferase [Gammaproteobacteria bacterium]|nr:SAM-dependent methyltransferase [Gammaproteobacteria bacterium]
MPAISQTAPGLPAPAPDALAHSRRLGARIREEIRAAGGAVPFVRYMELALYAPGLGYYSAGARKFGAAGDFVTAPELSPLFSRCLARQCAEVLQALGEGDVLELGAGSGVMAADMLLELERLERLPREYLILEVSADLRQRQRALLEARLPHLLPRVRWLDSLPERFDGVILGNEVLDALPAERFRKTATGYEQYCVAEQGEGFAWMTGVAPGELSAALSALESTLPALLPTGYSSEICTALPPLFASLSAALWRGAALFLDYGYPRAAYYHQERSMGTLMCHYRQRAHGDPFLYPGLQDITAHVDFTAVAEAATAAGFELAGYTTQAHFLMALGIAAFADAGLEPARQVKLLTLSEEMGERFKAIGFIKGMDVPLSGFALRDLSRTL